MGTKHKYLRSDKNYGALINPNERNLSWDYSDVTKTTAQKRRMNLTRVTNPLEPVYEYKYKDGSIQSYKLDPSE